MRAAPGWGASLPLCCSSGTLGLLVSLAWWQGDGRRKSRKTPHFCFSRSLDLTGPLLLGGVPDLPESFPVRTRHFVGCMRNLQVDSRHVDMADFIANNGTVPGMGAWGRGQAQSLGWKGGLCWYGDVVGVSEAPPATGFQFGAPREPLSLPSRLPCQEERV